MKLRYGIATVAIFLSAVSPVSANTQNPSGIYISEINWAGSEKSQADEWIELVNTTDTPQDISRWLLVGAATSGDAIALPDNTTIKAYETLLIANYKSSDPKSTLSVEPHLVTTALSLANSSLFVFLTDPHGLVHDAFEDTGTLDHGSTSPITSIERNLVTLAWQNSATSSGLTTNAQYGSPKSVQIPSNEIITTPSDEQEENTEEEVDGSEQVNTENIDPLPEQEVQETNDTQTGQETTTTENAEENNEQTPYEWLTQEEESLVVEEETDEPYTDSVQEMSEDEGSVAEQKIVDQIDEKDETSTPIVTPKVIAKHGEIRINEIFSAPSEGDEWLEIYNTTETTLSLDNWMLTDASEKSTKLSGDLGPKSYSLIKNPSGKLNNDGDTLTLINEQGEIIDKVTYGKDNIPAPKKDESVARNEQQWFIAEPSPLMKNPEQTTETDVNEEVTEETTESYEKKIDTSTTQVDTHSSTTQLAKQESTSTSDATDGVRRVIAIAQPVAEDEEVKSSPDGKQEAKDAIKTSEDVPHLAPSEVAKQKDKTKVTVTGTVIMEPMKVAKQVMYIEGLEIYFHAADWPEISTQHQVTLTGVVDLQSTNTRIKISSIDDIVVAGNIDNVAPFTVESSNNLEEIGSGRLITVHGELSLLTKTGFTLQTPDGDLAINLKAATDIATNELTTGKITVTGVLIKNKAGAFELFPRSSEDLKQDTATKTVTSEKNVGGTIAPPSEFPTTAAGLSLGAVAMGIIGYWVLKTKPELLTSLTTHIESYVR